MPFRYRHLVALCAALTLAAPAFSAKPEFVLKLHHFLGPKSPTHAKMLAPWARSVEDASNGRIKIDMYPSMTLGGRPPQLIRQLRDGVVDIVWTVNGYTPGVFPKTEVFELPFIHTNNPAATNLAIREIFDSHLADEYKGIKVLALHVHSGNGIHTVDTPVRTISDMAGLKIRTPTRTGSWMLEALGAVPVGMPVPELPQSLSRKLVDGAFIPWQIIPSLKLQELTRYQIEGKNNVRFGTIVFQLSMNQNTWNQLPDDLQKILTDSTNEEWLRKTGELWASWEASGLAAAIATGNEHIELDDAEIAHFRQTLSPVVDRWVNEMDAKGIDGEALVQAAQNAIAKHASP